MNNIYLAVLVSVILVVPFVVLNRHNDEVDRLSVPSDNIEGKYVCVDTADKLDLLYRSYSLDGGWSDFLKDNTLVRDVTCDTYEQFSFCCYYKLDIPSLDK